MLCFFGVANASDLTVTTFQNITDNCNYVSGTRTYNCSVDASGNVWDNINIANSISLPTSGVYSTNIIFTTKNNFVSKSIFALGGGADKDPGHDGGSIKIDAGNITIDGSLHNYGTYCYSYSCYSGSRDTYCRDGGYGGNVELISEKDVVLTGVINSYGGPTSSCVGGGRGGNGGSVYIVANNTINMTDINIYGSYGSGGGAGGLITAVSDTIKINNIDAQGKDGRTKYRSGGAGGQIDILSTYVELGNINLNGGTGQNYGGVGGNLILKADYIDGIGTISASTSRGRDQYGLIGGTVEIYSKGDLVLSSISANGGAGGSDDWRYGVYTGGPGGTVVVETKGILTVNSTIDTYGGSGGYKDDSDGQPGGPGGKIYLTAEEIRVNGLVRANGGVGGSADDWTDRGATGGVGGYIRIVSDILTTTQEIQAIGGNGGNGGACSSGGSGGAGGNIDIYNSDSLLVSRIDSVVRVNGGVGDASSRCNKGPSCVCGNGGAGGAIDLFNDDSIAISSEKFNVLGGLPPAVSASYCTGTCGYSGALGRKDLSSRTVPTGFRLTSNI
ncbi:MAG: hypothetical protein K0B07_04155, partial [DPANN group archaeon]|nr:hypothetical protein [DPANN group archaeon]